MLKILGTLVKTVVFGIAAIAAGQLIELQGRSLSDHVGSAVSFLKRTDTAAMVRRSVSTWSDTMSLTHSQARSAGATPSTGRRSKVQRSSSGPAEATGIYPIDGVSAEERRELRNLLAN